ncbi:hypothetical protein ACOSQ2_027150 [Xanthoceras sorbifolium]
MVYLLVEEVFRQTYPEEPLEAIITHGATKEDEDQDITECALRLNSAVPNPYGLLQNHQTALQFAC